VVSDGLAVQLVGDPVELGAETERVLGGDAGEEVDLPTSCPPAARYDTFSPRRRFSAEISEGVCAFQTHPAHAGGKAIALDERRDALTFMRVEALPSAQ